MPKPKLVNVTGRDPLVPASPMHPSVALVPEPRIGRGGKHITGYWRCPISNKVYIEQDDGLAPAM